MKKQLFQLLKAMSKGISVVILDRGVKLKIIHLLFILIIQILVKWLLNILLKSFNGKGKDYFLKVYQKFDVTLFKN